MPHVLQRLRTATYAATLRGHAIRMDSRCAPVRTVPLVVLVSASATADAFAAGLRQSGAAVYTAHSPQGCLRVATALGPDAIIVDDGFPDHVRQLLAAHPLTARTRIVHRGAGQAAAQLPTLPLATVA